MKWPGFCGPSNVTQSSLADAERTVNMYLEPVESEHGTTKVAMYDRPGVLTLDAQGLSTPRRIGSGRGHIFTSGREFLIVGTTLYEAPEHLSGTVDGPVYSVLTTRGTVSDDANPATMSGNGDAGDEIFITSGGNGYIYDLTANTLTAIAALAGKATMGGYLDGYFLALDAATSTLWISDLLDGATWDPTQFIVRVGAADPWVSMIVNQYIYLLGSQTSEVWFDAGTFPIPFELHPSGRLQQGCGAAFSPSKVGASVVWLGQTLNGDGSVLRTPGFSIEVISTFATELAFGGLVGVDDAIGDSFELRGHTFYILTFPRANTPSWVWDASTNAWFEWSTWNPETYAYEALRPIYHAFAFGQHRCLDLKSERLYEISQDYSYDAEGMELRRLRQPPALMNQNKRVFYSKIELFAEPGLGLTSGQGEDPQVAMEATSDGGKTWGAKVFRSAGKLGEYGKRLIWLRLGAARKRSFRFTFSDPVPFRILDAFVEMTPGRN